MTNLQSQFQTPLSPEESLQELKEQDVEEVTGGVVDPRPLLSRAEKNVARRITPDNAAHGTYDPPGWFQVAGPVKVIPESNDKQHVFEGKNLFNTIIKR